MEFHIFFLTNPGNLIEVKDDTSWIFILIFRKTNGYEGIDKTKGQDG